MSTEAIFRMMSNSLDQRSKETFNGFQICNISEGDKDQYTDLLYAYKVFASLCVLLTITATLGNSLILIALHKDTSLHPPSKILLRSLAITDLLVGALGQPVTITVILSAFFERWDLCRITHILDQCLNGMLCATSLLTLTAISLDRLLALLLRLRYGQVVTIKRVRAVVVLFWLITCLTNILVSVWSVPLYYLHILQFITIFPALLISTYSYTRIFLTIRRQQKQLQDSHGGQTRSSGLNMARYKKTVHNALWVHLTLLTCYLPLALTSSLTIVQGLNSSLFTAHVWGQCLVYLNSSLNPVLYCWKIKEVRQAVKEIVRQFCTCLSF